MALPSFDRTWRDGRQIKPRVLVLEVRERGAHDGAPIAHLLVERRETYNRTLVDDALPALVHEASIRLSYEIVLPKHSGTGERGYFGGSYTFYEHSGGAVSLTAGAVFLDPPALRGHRIGTYLMNEIVTWAKQWPEATVQPVELLEYQAQDANRARRNRLYAQFNLQFDYDDAEHRSGQSRRMPAASLTPVATWSQNIRERDVRDFLADALHDNDRMRFTLGQRDLAVERLGDELARAQARPIRWALLQIWRRFTFLLTSCALL